MIQLILLFSVGLLVTMPIVFLVRLVRAIANRGQVRGAVIPVIGVQGLRIGRYVDWVSPPANASYRRARAGSMSDLVCGYWSTVRPYSRRSAIVGFSRDAARAGA